MRRCCNCPSSTTFRTAGSGPPRWAAGASYQAPAPPLWTRRLDAVFLHPVAGPLIFALVVVAVFQTIFSGARPLMDAVQWLVAISGNWIGSVLPDSPLRSLLVEGVWGGVGSVLVFLPQILLLFLFIGILEDSGYLARAALIADRTMAKVGLQGKSFIPLLSAYACAVPAMLATRTIENKRDRIATILIAPFMTCSARLPVYTLIIAAFLRGPAAGRAAPRHSRGRHARPVRSRLSGRVFHRARSEILHPQERAHALRSGDAALPPAHAAVAWAAAPGSRQDLPAPRRNRDPGGRRRPVDHGPPSAARRASRRPSPTVSRAPSAATIEPVIKPLGFNWKIGLGLVSSLAAREVIVGTLGTIYGMEGDAHSTGLQKALQRDLAPGGAVALLVFFAFAMQCMSTLAVVRRETGGWRWPILQFTYMGLLAYVCAFIANRVVTAWFV